MKKPKVLFVYPNCMLENLIPIGASVVLGVLRNLDLEVRLFDTTFHRTEDIPADIERVENLQVAPFDSDQVWSQIKDIDVREDFRRQVTEFKPDMIMISFVESTFSIGMKLLEAVRDIKPMVVAGGVYTILAPEDVITSDLIDAVCVGEGETSVAELCRRFFSHQEYKDIKGMWFKTEDGIRKNPLGPLTDLDSAVFPDFSVYDKDRFYKPMQGRTLKMLPIEFSRGCPYRCSYCANHALESHFKPAGRWHRWKSLDRIFSEIDQFSSQYGVEFLYFVSESFLSMQPAMFDEFCQRYAAYKIPFWFNTRPESITAERLEALEKINCFRIGVGLEHGSPEFRVRMLNRRVSNETIIAACRLLDRSRISYSINNIIGFPGETREMVFETIALNKCIAADSVGTFVFTPFRGTTLYDYCLERNYISQDTPTGDLNRLSVLKNNTLSPTEIKGLLRTFPLYVHFSEDRYPMIEKAESLTEEGNQVFARLAQEYRQAHFTPN